METYETQGTSVQTGVWQASATLTGRMDTCIRPTDNRSCDLCTSAKDERGEKENLKWSYRARVPHEGEAEMYQVRLCHEWAHSTQKNKYCRCKGKMQVVKLCDMPDVRLDWVDNIVWEWAKMIIETLKI